MQNLPMLPPTLPYEPDDAGNRDRHAGMDATGNFQDVSSPENVPTRLSAWRSFPRRRPRRVRGREEGAVSLIYKDFLPGNPLRGTAGNFLQSAAGNGTYGTYGTYRTYGTDGTTDGV